MTKAEKLLFVTKQINSLKTKRNAQKSGTYKHKVLVSLIKIAEKEQEKLR